MAENEKGLYDRIVSHPITVIGLFAFWTYRGFQRNWNFPWWWWTIYGLLGIWFLWKVIDLLWGGRLSEWFDSLGEEGTIEVPESLSEFRKHSKHDSPLIKELQKIIDHPEAPADKLLENCDLEDVKEIGDLVGFLAAFRELSQKDDDRAGDLLSVFRSPGSSEAFGAFYQLGMPLVHERFRAVASRETDASDLRNETFLTLALLSGYAYRPAFKEIVQSAQNPKLSESYMWGTIFDAGNENDPDFIDLLQLCGKDLPSGFACVAFLDRCNRLSLDEMIDPHPFSSDAGMARLSEYFQDADPEHFSYARSAATALPFLSHPSRDQLLDLASRHPDPNASVEAAWAGAKLGLEKYVASLSDKCLDWKTGSLAREFLSELGLDDRIPPEAMDWKLVALGEAANWLQHPNELARFPDKMEIADRRKIYWPPSEEIREVALIHWESGEKKGFVMYGGEAIWCFFAQDEPEEFPLDTYALHSNWEMRATEMEDAPDDYQDLAFGRKLLIKKNPGEDWSARPDN